MHTPGIAGICSLLPSLGSLEHLDIGANAVGDEGAKMLSRPLRDATPRLRSLGLAGNNVKAQGAQAISSLVRCNPALEELHMEVRSFPPPPLPLTWTSSKKGNVGLCLHLTAKLAACSY